MAQNALVRFLKKCRPYTILKGLRYLRHYGVKEFFVRLQERIEPEEVPYGPWYEQHRATEETLEKQRRKKWNSPALISLAVPAYRTPRALPAGKCWIPCSPDLSVLGAVRGERQPRG